MLPEVDDVGSEPLQADGQGAVSGVLLSGAHRSSSIRKAFLR